MLTAMVLVCSLVTKGDCVLFTDNRGPYDTHEKCFARVEEMIRDLQPTLPNVPSEFRYKCEAKDKGTPT
jgi:hypothetical protein